MIAACVPLKRLAFAKSRLAPDLSPDERALLARSLFRRTIEVLKESGVASRVAVATAERTAIGALDVEVLPDTGELNSSLKGAIRWATRIGATRLLILPGDLPLLSPDDVRKIVDVPHQPPDVVIVGTQKGGTGALLLSPPSAISPLFGERSFERHLELARRTNIPAQICDVRGFSLDIDTVEDLNALAARLPSPD